MPPYNCVWAEGSLDSDNRSHYGVCTLVNNALDKAELGFIHRNGFDVLPPDAKGAVVIVHGEHMVSQAQAIIHRLDRLYWSLVIVIGDDAALFPVERLQGPRRKIWVQMGIPGHHDFARKITCGFPHDAPSFLEHYQDLPRRYVFSFSGQVNHCWRQECVDQLDMMPDGFLMRTSGFWQGLPRDEYYRLLAESKFVACPSGACTPDTLRVFEALEAGAIPVADDRWPPGYPRGSVSSQTGYWKYVFGFVPFPTLTSWLDFPSIIEEWSQDYEARRERLQLWWRGYKNEMSRWLEEDVRSISS